MPHKMLILHYPYKFKLALFLLNTPDTNMSMSLESIANPLAIDPNIYTLASGNSKKVKE